MNLENEMPIMPTAVFPSFDDRGSSLATNVRKKHKGKWYLFPIITSAQTVDRSVLLSVFLSNVYKAITFGKVDTKLKDHFGNHVFRLDHNQQTEEQRLIPIF